MTLGKDQQLTVRIAASSLVVLLINLMVGIGFLKALAVAATVGAFIWLLEFVLTIWQGIGPYVDAAAETPAQQMQKKVNDLNSALANNRAAGESMAANVRRLEREQKTLLEDISTLRHRLANQHDELPPPSGSCPAALSSRLSEKEDMLNKKDAEIAQAKAEYEKVQQASESAANQIQQLKAEAEKLNITLDLSKSNIALSDAMQAAKDAKEALQHETIRAQAQATLDQKINGSDPAEDKFLNPLEMTITVSLRDRWWKSKQA